MAAMCAKAGDSQLLDTFLAGKDLYSEIASKSFNVPYEDCKEFRPDGTVNPEGKERRTQAKSILLGKQLPLVKVILQANYVNLITQGCVA